MKSVSKIYYVGENLKHSIIIIEYQNKKLSITLFFRWNYIKKTLGHMMLNQIKRQIFIQNHKDGWRLRAMAELFTSHMSPIL